MADSILDTGDILTCLTEETRDGLISQKTSVFEVAEFIKYESARIKEVTTGRDCSLVSVAARVVEALKKHKDLKKYGVPYDYLAEHIMVVLDDTMGGLYYDIIWSDVEGVNTKIGFWIDDIETLHIGLGYK